MQTFVLLIILVIVIAIVALLGYKNYSGGGYIQRVATGTISDVEFYRNIDDYIWGLRMLKPAFDEFNRRFNTRIEKFGKADKVPVGGDISLRSPMENTLLFINRSPFVQTINRMTNYITCKNNHLGIEYVQGYHRDLSHESVAKELKRVVKWSIPALEIINRFIELEITTKSNTPTFMRNLDLTAGTIKYNIKKCNDYIENGQNNCLRCQKIIELLDDSNSTVIDPLDMMPPKTSLWEEESNYSNIGFIRTPMYFGDD